MKKTKVYIEIVMKVCEDENDLVIFKESFDVISNFSINIQILTLKDSMKKLIKEKIMLKFDGVLPEIQINITK
jgi:hypothetical protein